MLLELPDYDVEDGIVRTPTLQRQREGAGAAGLSLLEHRLLLLMEMHRKEFSPLVLAYRKGVPPSDAAIAAFMGIPQVAVLRDEYTDVEIVKALATGIETALGSMGE